MCCRKEAFCLSSCISRSCCDAVATEKSQFKSREEAGDWKKSTLWISLLPGPIIHPLFYRTCHTVMRRVCPVSNQWSKDFVLCFSNHHERLICTARTRTSVQLYSLGADSWLSQLQAAQTGGTSRQARDSWDAVAPNRVQNKAYWLSHLRTEFYNVSTGLLFEKLSY